MALQAAFRTGSIFEACDEYYPHWAHTTRGEETQSQGCGADSFGICYPVVVRQLLEDAVPESGFCLALSNVFVVREASV